MILRKPYKFIIKYFKLIHFILFLLTAYILTNTSGILNFYQDFVSNSYFTELQEFASDYFNILTFMALLIINITLTILFLLLKKKRKSSSMYLYGLIYYVFLLGLYMFSNGVLQQLEITTVETSVVRFYRDIFNIVFYPQYILVIYLFLKAIGFDVKTFTFNPVEEEIDIVDSDNEEFDISIDFDFDTFKRGLRKSFREFKYYIIENKFIFSIIAGGILVFSVGMLFVNIQTYNQSYHVNESFALSGFNVAVKDSVITDKNYEGDIIADGKYYLAVIINVHNLETVDKKLDTSLFTLEEGDNLIYPIPDRSGNFVDLASPYYSTTIPGEFNNDYIIVFEVSEVKSSYTLKIMDGVSYNEEGVAKTIYKNIDLDPVDATQEFRGSEVTIGEELVLNKTNLLDTKVTINNFEINDYYEYSYNYCYDEDCLDSKNSVVVDPNKDINKTLLILDMDVIEDDNAFYFNDITVSHNFYEDFIRVNYIINGKSYVAEVIDVTPDLVTNRVILKTSANIKNADSLNVLITVRNITSKITLK